MRLVAALLVWLIAGPAWADGWTATKIYGPNGGNNAREVDRIARSVETWAILESCTDASPPFAFDCAAPAAPPEESEATLPPGKALPDGTVTYAPEWSDLNAAWYADPTDRYGHGALGDRIEATTLVVERKDGRRSTITLPDTEVFEDRAPYIVDLDGFGHYHLVTIVADVTNGAAVVVFAVTDGGIERVAQTPFIGTRYRWLNIAGIADFDGSGSTSIALVKTPHLAGVLQFWRWSRGTLSLTAEAAGFSNHENGSREQRLSALADFDGDGVTDLALPGLDRATLRFVRFADREAGTFDVFASVPLPARIDKPIAVHWRSREPCLPWDWMTVQFTPCTADRKVGETGVPP